MKVYSCKYVHASDVFKGLPKAWDALASRDNLPFSWGDNNCGQLGLPTNYTRVPARISGLSNITQIAAGGHHGLAMDNGGRVFAWGHNNSGQLGTGTTADSSVPLLVSNLRPCRWISASCDHSVSVGD